MLRRVVDLELSGEPESLLGIEFLIDGREDMGVEVVHHQEVVAQKCV